MSENATSTPPETITLVEDKQCKGSVRYANDDPDSPLSTIYINRNFQRPMPKSVKVTIEAVG